MKSIPWFARWLTVSTEAGIEPQLPIVLRAETMTASLGMRREFVMTEVETLEQRVAALEREVADLRQQLTVKKDGNWLARVAGVVKDEDAFWQAMEYAKEFRNADRPEDEPSDGK
jgi:hypothetical protein